MTDVTELLREIAALKRYDVNARLGRTGGKITLNAPPGLLERIDAALHASATGADVMTSILRALPPRQTPVLVHIERSDFAYYDVAVLDVTWYSNASKDPIIGIVTHWARLPGHGVLHLHDSHD